MLARAQSNSVTRPAGGLGLGITDLRLLRYPDGRLAEADPAGVIARIAQAVRQVRPQVVVTFGPDGATGHPDHIAISQFTTAALLRDADPAYPTDGGEAPTRARLELYDRVFGASAMTVAGITRAVPGWPEWALSAGVATGAYAEQVWRAISCHRLQFSRLAPFAALSPAARALLQGTTTLLFVGRLDHFRDDARPQLRPTGDRNGRGPQPAPVARCSQGWAGFSPRPPTFRIPWEGT